MSSIAMMNEPLQRITLPSGAAVAWREAGEGPPLLLLHGHPQTHLIWHKLWPELTKRWRCIAPDLRGYGDSDRPASSPPHDPYTKRAMAQVLVDFMAARGYARFQVLAHDRGARVAHRLGLDHPQAVERLMLLDIAPTLDMYAGTNATFARQYFHWFFLIQPAPLPETLISADPVAYVRSVMGGRRAGLAPFAPEIRAEYERCARLPGWAHGVCEDYRAAATTDLDHDRASRDAGQKLDCPVRVLWGKLGVVEQHFDVPALWAAQCREVSASAVPCGHYIPEEAPSELLAEVQAFFRA